MNKQKNINLSILFLATFFNGVVYATPCLFDTTKDCSIQRDILNDKNANNLRYFAATNYDHRISGEINVYDSNLISAYSDSVNKPGQIKFILNKINTEFYKAGEIMTRANLNLSPFNSPTLSAPWTTKELNHGYLEVIVKMPTCDTSADGACQNKTAPNNYSSGLWPAIWLMPTDDSAWPKNGEIDISEAYYQNSDFKLSTAALHFNGQDPSCYNNDCVGAGYGLTSSIAKNTLWNDFHSWGFEWQPDTASKTGGKLITAYFDNVKVWGPLSTDKLPADGANALNRGFNDPNGGYYLIVNLAMGGPYAGFPNPQLQNSSMYIQSVKAYGVSNSPPAVCLPPANIQSMFSPDKKQITLAWMEPSASAGILYYQIANWQQQTIWKGASAKDRVFQDQTLPGSKGNFDYYFSTTCTNGVSAKIKYTAVVPIKKK